MKCLNAFNEIYFSEFNSLVQDAKIKNSKNLMITYRKVASSIQRYPFPILTPNQAMCLEGVGETISKLFEKIIKNYKLKIQNENINYIEQAYNIQKNKDKKAGKRKNESDSEDIKNIKSRKKLSNIEPFTSYWTAVISCFISFLQTNSYNIDIDDVITISVTMAEDLKLHKKIEICDLKDIKQLKNYELIDNLENKNKKVKINEFLIKLAKIELKKVNIVFENSVNGLLKFSIDNSDHSFDKPLVSESSSKSGSKSSNKTLDYFVKSFKKMNYNDPNENEILKINFPKIDTNHIIKPISLKKSKLAESYDKFTSHNKIDYSNNIILLIDNREKGSNGENLKDEILKKKDIKIEERNLSVGDFMWIYLDPNTLNEYVLEYIIERKSLSDLAKSIIDGRYTEQKYRLKSTKLKNIYYLFEGNSFTSYNNISKSSINTAIYNTLNIHDINIIKTNSLEDTVKYLIRFDFFIKSKFISVESLLSYNEFSYNYNKTKNSNLESIFIRQLRCVNFFKVVR